GGELEAETPVKRMRLPERGLEVAERAVRVCLREDRREQPRAEAPPLVPGVDPDEGQIPVRLSGMELFELGEAAEDLGAASRVERAQQEISGAHARRAARRGFRRAPDCDTSELVFVEQAVRAAERHGWAARLCEEEGPV